jgi:hypothetical protein
VVGERLRGWEVVWMGVERRPSGSGRGAIAAECVADGCRRRDLLDSAL